MEYQAYLSTERNVFSGEVVSVDTQKARLRAVISLFSRLYYHGVIPEPVRVGSPGDCH